MDGDKSEPSEPGLLGRGLSAVTYALANRPKWTLFFVLLSCIISLGWTASSLRFKTDRSDLIDPQADFQKRWLRYTDRFGSTPDALVVAEASDATRIPAILDAVGKALEKEPELFSNVQWKTDTAGLRAKGLQFLPPAVLEEGLRRLDEFEPILEGRWDRAELAATVRHLSDQVEDGLRRQDFALLQSALGRAGLLVSSLTGFVRDPQSFTSPWPEIIPASVAGELAGREAPQYQLSDDGTMGFLLVNTNSTGEDFSGGSKSISRLREIVAAANRKYADVHLGLTGIPILEADEMQRSQQDMGLASILSSVIVLAIMLLGFGGFRHPLISMLMLGVGVCWSLMFATVAVGHLNILSMSFASILIGLGVDYAIHYLEHYLELRHAGVALIPALARTAGSVGSGILTCAMATALSFFCAALTSFQGVKELGIIAGGGVLLCVVAAFVSLPPLVVFADRNVEPGRLPRPFSGKSLQTLVARFPWFMGLASALIVIAGGCFGFRWSSQGPESRVIYDSNLLNMQVQEVESVKLQQRVFDRSKGSLLYGVSMASSPAEARSLREQFMALPAVGRVVELGSAMPATPVPQIIPLVSEFQSRLERVPAELPQSAPSNPAAALPELERLAALLRMTGQPETVALAEGISQFTFGLRQVPSQQLGQLLGGYQQGMLLALHGQFRALLGSADPRPASANDLPEALRSRFVSSRGDWAIHVYPARQVWDEAALTEFVQQVRSVDSEITGTPLQNFEAARQIRDSYFDSAIYATAMIVVVLLIDFLPMGTLAVSLITPAAVVVFAAFSASSRGIELSPSTLAGIYAAVAFAVGAVFDASSVFKTFCALLPPVAGGFLMFGIMGMTGMNLNPANMIVLPLLLGMGVDAGIYVVHDYREQTAAGKLAGRYRMSTCTINSIIMISTTTVVGFGCMIVSAHRGIVSLGLTLTIGVTCSMLVSLITLPALLTVLDRWNAWRIGSTAEVENLPEVAPAPATSRESKVSRGATVGAGV